MGLKGGVGLHVDEVDGHGWPAAAEPEEGVLEGGAPRGAEEDRRVLDGEDPTAGSVLFEVEQDPGDQLAELVVGGGCCTGVAVAGPVGSVGKDGEQLFEVGLLLDEPGVEGGGEARVNGLVGRGIHI